MGLFGGSKQSKAEKASQAEMLRTHNESVDAYWRSSVDPSPEARREMERAYQAKSDAYDAHQKVVERESARRGRRR
ncbi:hypothetical protein ACFCXC_35220 [Streptomyces microflavus]|uniref:hypothetical protein n=1 Tax=Streptomyces griseus group TaxID=629295 RepID=UPI0006E2355C|nr:hypothetical protein [Streptomyces luridiscabiei]